MIKKVFGFLLNPLLLTLLVPVIGRHIAFVSPWGAFVVLAAVVTGIMLQVATSEAYLPAEPVAGAAQGALMTRYLLVESAQGPGLGFSLSPVQKFAFLLALAAVVLSFAARLVNAEAGARRMGLFLYVFIAALILALFALVSAQGDATLFSGAPP